MNESPSQGFSLVCYSSAMAFMDASYQHVSATAEQKVYRIWKFLLAILDEIKNGYLRQYWSARKREGSRQKSLVSAFKQAITRKKLTGKAIKAARTQSSSSQFISIFQRVRLERLIPLSVWVQSGQKPSYKDTWLVCPSFEIILTIIGQELSVFLALRNCSSLKKPSFLITVSPLV